MVAGSSGGLIANFIIAGVPKAGTSSLYRWLSDHPDVVGSSEKETYFFADPNTHMYRPGASSTRDPEAYADYFRSASGAETIRFESTPAYLYYREALCRIPDLPTRPKCLFIVREPSSQIYSLFRYFRENWNWIPPDLTFRGFVDAVREGRATFNGNELARDALRNAIYADFLGSWRKRLGPDRFRVSTMDELRAHPDRFVKELAAWLGIEPGFYDGYGFPRENETYAVRNRPLQTLNIAVRGRLPKGRVYDALRNAYRSLNTCRPSRASTDDLDVMESLRAFFRPHNQRLERDFGLDLSGW